MKWNANNLNKMEWIGNIGVHLPSHNFFLFNLLLFIKVAPLVLIFEHKPINILVETIFKLSQKGVVQILLRFTIEMLTK